MGVSLDWSSFWSCVKTMPYQTLAVVGRELGGNDFVDWVGARSPKVQIEIMEECPKHIQQYFFPFLSDVTIEMLDIEAPEARPTRETAGLPTTYKRSIRITDNRRGYK